MPKSHGGSAGGGKKSSSVTFTKPEPSFIRKMKQQMGFREDTQKLADKFGNGGAEGGALTERDDLDDEKPVVVVVHDGDLSEGEAKEIEDRLGPKNKEDEEDDEAFPEDGKIRFKKPVAKKRTVEQDDKSEGKQSKPKKKEKKAKKNLLSFGNDEVEEEDDE